MPIRPLSKQTVNLMVAGEAIDSLAAVVRELVENALDAGANRISVQVWPQRWAVNVTDDGSGMSVTELRNAALPYCTSKLDVGEGALNRVKTLGFRGEALHSLAQVSQLEIRTCPRSTEGGSEGDPHDYRSWLALYDRDGIPTYLQPAPAAKGTSVSVRDLFVNWPTRRSALSGGKVELRRIADVLQSAALAHPNVTWSLQVDDKTTLELWPGDSAADLLPQIVRRLERSHLVSLSVDVLTVTFGLPDRYHRPRPDWVRIAVNGRFVHLPQMIHTIQAAFHRTLPRDRHPLCIVHLHLPPESVDWNRHPAKTELYVQDIDDYCDRLRSTIQTGLANCAPSAYERSRQFLSNRQGAVKLSESSGEFGQGLESVRVLGQVQNTYILVETVQGVLLVEQHVAHERVQYEHLQQAWELVDMTEPFLLSGLSDCQIERLEELGLAPEEFGDSLWAFRKLPALLVTESDTAAALLDLACCSNMDLAKATLACRTAIKNGLELSKEEMERLVRQWQATHNPHTCPHGRPIYLALNESDLARFFRRSWTVCSKGWGSGNSKLGDRLSADIRSQLPISDRT